MTGAVVAALIAEEDAGTVVLTDALLALADAAMALVLVV